MNTAPPTQTSLRPKPHRPTQRRRVLEPLDVGPEQRVRWGFLSNHCHVLLCLHLQPSMPIREVSARVGITFRAVQRIIAELAEEGVIEIEKNGRNNHYTINGQMNLRHPLEEHHTVKALLALLET